MLAALQGLPWFALALTSIPFAVVAIVPEAAISLFIAVLGGLLCYRWVANGSAADWLFALVWGWEEPISVQSIALRNKLRGSWALVETELGYQPWRVLDVGLLAILKGDRTKHPRIVDWVDGPIGPCALVAVPAGLTKASIETHSEVIANLWGFPEVRWETVRPGIYSLTGVLNDPTFETRNHFGDPIPPVALTADDFLMGDWDE